jgi:diguanylate cyclase (GGDEF)-like protein
VSDNENPHELRADGQPAPQGDGQPVGDAPQPGASHTPGSAPQAPAPSTVPPVPSPAAGADAAGAAAQVPAGLAARASAPGGHASAPGGHASAPPRANAQPADAPAGEEGVSRAGTLARLASPRSLAWAALALVLLAGGIAGSLLGAHAVAHNDAVGNRRAAQQGAVAAASTAKLALQRDQELGVSGATFFAGNAKATPGAFARWAKWAQTLRRYPELQQLGLVTLVHAPELPAFAARVTGKRIVAPATGAGPATAGAAASASTSAAAAGTGAAATAGTGAASPSAATSAASASAARTAAESVARAAALIAVRPAGARSYYCLALSTLTRHAGEAPRRGLDYCSTRAGLLVSRDTALNHYVRTSAASGTELEVLMPVYLGNQPPATSGARMAAFAGWLREVLAPEVIVQEALQEHAGDALQLSFHSSSAHLQVAGGASVGAGARPAAQLRSGAWTVRSFAAPVGTGVLADGDAVALLIVGCALSVLLAALAFVLGTGHPQAPVRALAQGGTSEPAEDLHDRLTGLPNRALMIDRAECMLARAGRQHGLLVGALFIDIDWFADVNERLGRDAGDQILKIVAQRLENVVRAGDTVGRLGGDEFVLLVETAARGARLDSLARRVVEALHKPFDLDERGPSFFLTASIGVAFGRYTHPEDLLRDAQLALHAAKSAGKDRYTLFNANMRSVIEGRGVLEAELNTALAEKQFFLLYEPIYDLRTGQVAGLEALVRWLHPKQGVLLPGDFMPLAEETGLAVPIGRWALEEACARAAAWSVAGYPVGVSVEITANQLNREGFVTDVRRALQQSGIEPSLLTLEVAETTVMRDVGAAVEHLQEIKQLGVRIAIDDFGGSGYAYHSDLRRLPLDFLRVDRSSLAASEDEDYRTWLLEAIMIVGRDLSLTVIAKGIESLEQLGALQEMGCTMAQGAMMGKAVPASNIETVLVSTVPIARADAQSA